MNRAYFSVFSCLLLVVLSLAACDLLPSFKPQPLVVPLPTYATGGPEITRAPSLTVDPNFWSNGSYIQGWWWVRDDAYKTSANWLVDIPAGSGDITFNLTVLATGKADGGRGASAVFFLTYGQAGGSQVDGTLYGRKLVELPNTSPPSDPVGYTCTGTLTLTRAEIRNATKLWFNASRKDALGEFPSATVHVAFNKQSVVVRK